MYPPIGAAYPINVGYPSNDRYPSRAGDPNGAVPTGPEFLFDVDFPLIISLPADHAIGGVDSATKNPKVMYTIRRMVDPVV